MKVILRLTVLMLFMIFCPAIFSQNSLNEDVGQAKLEEILSKAKEYCRRLENAALDFVCVEEATEIIDYSKEIVIDSTSGGRPPIPIPQSAVKKNSYIYDYQFVRKGSQKIEKRILVKKNGKKMHVENAPPMTTALRITNVLFGPVGLLGPARQTGYEFRIVGDGIFNGQHANILETSPRFTVDETHCFGRIWVEESEASILKIEWDPRSIGNSYIYESTAKKYNAEPRVTSISEYGLEKNGIRFPTRDMTEEAYILGNGKKFVLARTTIIYKDYKFFTVETEVKY